MIWSSIRDIFSFYDLMDLIDNVLERINFKLNPLPWYFPPLFSHLLIYFGKKYVSIVMRNFNPFIYEQSYRFN